MIYCLTVSGDIMVLPHKLHISLFIRLSRSPHLAALAVLGYTAFLLFDGEKSSLWQPSTASTLLYVSSFATHFGTQIWMTLISGIVLFFNVPRRVFGLVQRHLFPKYFLINSVLGFLTLLTFVVHHPVLEPQLLVQRCALAICFICDLIAMVYIVPDMVKTMELRSAMEAEVGVGEEIGRYEPGNVLKSCPKYTSLHARFRKFHSACAIVNIVAMGCNGLHMYHLAWKLCVALT